MMRLMATGLACERGGRPVFSGLDLAVDGGQALAVVGPNGAGKTSLLRVLAGLLPAAAGRVSLAGGEPEASLPEQTHYLGHQDALKPALTVKENLAFWTAYLGGAGGAADGPLASVGLSALAETPAAYLSAGQRRRLSLARLLAVRRPVWLLDEPTAALDAAAQAMLGGLMRTHLAGGGIMVAATHGPLPVEGTELRLGGAPS